MEIFKSFDKLISESQLDDATFSLSYILLNENCVFFIKKKKMKSKLIVSLNKFVIPTYTKYRRSIALLLC